MHHENQKDIEFPAQVHQKSILDIPTSKMMYTQKRMYWDLLGTCLEGLYVEVSSYQRKNKLYATITGRLHSDSILEYLYLIEIPANNIIQEAESWPFPIYGQYYNIKTWWISRVCSIR